MTKLNTITLVHVSDAGTTSQEIEVPAMLEAAAPGWTTYSACAAIEGFDGEVHDDDEIIAAFQHLIDTGVAWQLQGFYSMSARDLIDRGLCHIHPRH